MNSENFIHSCSHVVKKVKEVDLYSAFIEVPYTQGAQVRITGSHSVTCKLHRTCLYLVSIHQMAHPRLRLRTSNHMAEDIAKLLSRPGSPIILVFDPSANTQFQGEPLQRGRKIHRDGKICDFRLKSPFISETVWDRPNGPWLLWNVNSKS